MRSPRWWLEPRAAFAVLVAAAITAGWSLRRAIVLEPLPSAQPLAHDSLVPIAPAGADRDDAELLRAVGVAPFRPDRKRPKVRFRLPGEPLRGGGTQPTDAPFRLIGTAVLAEGHGFAMCQVGQEPPRLVRLGERVGDLVLHRVEQGRATFLTESGSRVQVAVPKAGT